MLAALLPVTPRTAVPHPKPGAFYPPVGLARTATPPGGHHYALTSYWEERCRGVVQRMTLTKKLFKLAFCLILLRHET